VIESAANACYDEDSSRIRLRKRGTQVITYDFDNLDREYFKNIPSGTANDVYTVFDLAGRPDSVRFVDASGQGIIYARDTAKRLTGETTFGRALTFQLDAAGNRTRLTWPDANYIQYDVDPLNRVTKVRENGASSGVGVLATYAYNALSLRTGITRGNAANSTLGFDIASRLSSLGHDPASTAQDVTFAFSYTPAGQLLNRSHANALYTWSPGAVTRAYVPDGLNRYATVAGVSFTHDANGNLTGDGTRTFGYDVENRPENAVSLTMPVRADQYDSMGGLLPLFEMNLPEGTLREHLRLRFAKVIPEFDDLHLLGIVGASQIGRLRYSTAESLDGSVPGQSLEEILRYEGSADLFAHLLERYATHSGISGVQPKLLIRDLTPPDRLTVTGATHIVKSFDPSEYPELAANEHLCTLGAQAAGIRTVRTQISSNRRFLVVDRFDLVPDQGYVGVEDFCVLDGRRAHGRYDGSYEAIARRIGDFVSPSALDTALEQFTLQVIYACAIGNGDAHLKNFSVIYRNPEDVVELAPAYDLVSTLPYLPRDTLALTLGGSKAFPDRARLTTFVRHITGKTERAAADLLAQAATGVEHATALALEFGREHEAAEGFIASLVRVLKAGTARLAGIR